MKIRENSEQFNQQMKKIAQCLVDVSVRGWQRMILGVFQGDGIQSLVIYAQLMDNSVVDITKKVIQSENEDVINAYMDLCDDCEELYEMCEKQKDAWTSCAFWVMPSGSFSIDFDYTPFDTLTVEVVEQWKKYAFAFLDEEN